MARKSAKKIAQYTKMVETKKKNARRKQLGLPPIGRARNRSLERSRASFRDAMDIEVAKQRLAEAKSAGFLPDEVEWQAVNTPQDSANDNGVTQAAAGSQLTASEAEIIGAFMGHIEAARWVGRGESPVMIAFPKLLYSTVFDYLKRSGFTPY